MCWCHDPPSWRNRNGGPTQRLGGSLGLKTQTQWREASRRRQQTNTKALCQPPPPLDPPSQTQISQWEQMKFTRGNIDLGHFLFTNFWVPDPPPFQIHPWRGGGVSADKPCRGFEAAVAFGAFAGDKKYLVHEGMMNSARWVCAEVLEPLQKLVDAGYRVVVLGHSLGAAVAAGCTILLRRTLPKVSSCAALGSG